VPVTLAQRARGSHPWINRATGIIVALILNSFDARTGSRAGSSRR
jgi:hypothetical protein